MIGGATLECGDRSTIRSASMGADDFKAGDKVSWNTSQGRTHGVVVRRLTAETHIKNHKVAATPDAPQYLVRSNSSGEEAAHKPAALKRE
jgi:uncharacterized protein YijF (DUF1287 family)